jgi:oligoribonuclease NrnB/cAMP/cGMP phosphodiesterase (DHH superfamily)
LRPEEMLVLLNYTQNIIWLDHHKTTMDKYVDFPYEIKGIREEGERAGCLLAWDYFVTAHNPEQTTAPLIVTLLSDYDTWTLKFEDSKYLNYGLQSVDTSPSGGLWNRLLMDDLEVKRFIEGGKFVLGFAQRRGKELAESYEYFAELDGANIFVMHNPNPGKDWFWLLRDNKADAYARVAFDGRRYMVSLYSEIIDVSVICKNHGGGGHPGAAGFVCKDLPFSPV